MSRQLKDGCKGLLLYLSSLPLTTLEEVWEWNGNISFAEESLQWLNVEYKTGFETRKLFVTNKGLLTM